MAAFKVS